MSHDKRLIASHNHAVALKAAAEAVGSGIVFWQKTSFFRHCNLRGFQAVVQLVGRKYLPTSVEWLDDRTVFFVFDHDKNKFIYLMLKQEAGSKHCYLYGASQTARVDADFHIFALDVVAYIAKQIGARFYVNDASGYVTGQSRADRERYISADQA